MGLFFPRLPDTGCAGRQYFSVTAVAAVHVALIAVIAMAVPAEEVKKAIRPIAVRLVEMLPSQPQPVKPPEAPRPKQTLPPPPVQVLTTTTAAAAPTTIAAPPQVPQPPAPAAAVVAAAVSVAPAPVAVTAARFDADFLNNPKPAYPPASRRLGEQGRVLLRVHVNPAGLAEQVEIKSGSGFARLDQAASDAVSRWRFVPARRGEQAIAAWVQVPVTFQLES